MENCNIDRDSRFPLENRQINVKVCIVTMPKIMEYSHDFQASAERYFIFELGLSFKIGVVHAQD